VCVDLRYALVTDSYGSYPPGAYDAIEDLRFKENYRRCLHLAIQASATSQDRWKFTIYTPLGNSNKSYANSIPQQNNDEYVFCFYFAVHSITITHGVVIYAYPMPLSTTARMVHPDVG
jgi:hypothetical protein